MKFKRSQEGAALVLHPIGDIFETLGPELSNALAAAPAGELVFDCAKVDRINSIGVRTWVDALQKHASRLRYRFRNCPESFVLFMNLAPSFICGGVIESLDAPYHCEACEKRSLITFDARKIDPNQELPATQCPHCKAEMQPEVDAVTYLACLRMAKKPTS